MKVFSPSDNHHITNLPSKPASRQVVDDFSTNFPNSAEMQKNDLAKFEISSSTRKFLTSIEMTTLHILFGSKKPEELTFYNHERIHHIHRGHLIDVLG